MKRININLDDATFEELQQLAIRKGKTMSQLLRDSLALEKWFMDTRDQGDRILVENSSTLVASVPTISNREGILLYRQQPTPRLRPCAYSHRQRFADLRSLLDSLLRFRP